MTTRIMPARSLIHAGIFCDPSVAKKSQLQNMDKKEYFDQMSDGWDARFYTADLLKKLEYLVAQFELQKGATILDVGTGTGGLLHLLLRYIGNTGFISAVDFSARMLKKGSEKFRDKENLKFSNAAVEELPFKSGYFDRVICFGAFPHFEHKGEALYEMNRVLKEGGELFIAHALGSKKLMDHHKGASPVACDVLPEEAEMLKMMREKGFINISITDREEYYLCRGGK